MNLFEFPELLICQISLLAISVWWLLKRNDEIPLLITAFFFYCASYRYFAVTSGFTDWVHSRNFGLEPLTDRSALSALSYIVFGEICLVVTYMLRQKDVLPVIRGAQDQRFFRWLRPKLILGGLLCLPLVIVTRSNLLAQLQAGNSIAYQISGYLYLFPMILVGVTTLILCLWKFNGLPTLFSKVAATLIVIGVFYLTFSPVSRFQFLGWIIASGIIFSSTFRPKARLIIFTCLTVIGLSLFSVAGAMRNTQLAGDSLNRAALERTFIAEDANMLDGFALVKTVYPKYLEFSFGMEHVEILLRPIPRALWPNKPVGGYVNKLGLFKSRDGSTLGISPTLFGSFYGEGGLLGIFFFSVVYGNVFAALVRYSSRVKPIASVLIRAILAACLIPLLRGGDLPGVYAWVGMAFWPCFLLLWLKRKSFTL